MENFLKNVTIFDHPLIAHKITHLCDVTTGTKEFREIVSEIAMLMGYEAFRDLPTEEIEIQAPLSKFKSKIVTEKITIVPILRAGTRYGGRFNGTLPKGARRTYRTVQGRRDAPPRGILLQTPQGCAGRAS